MKKRQVGKWILLVMGAMFLVVVVPIIINESYKAKNGYMTMWGPADVLSYYGIILGSLITILALTITIRFTKKQIQRESYLKAKREKWNNIEDEIVKALEEINPARTSELINQALSHNRDEIIVSLRSCMLRAETAMDALRGYITTNDAEILSPLLSAMTDYSEKYCDSIGQLVSQFFNLQLLEKVRQTNIVMQGIQDPAKRLNYQLNNQALFAAAKGLTNDSIINEISLLQEQLNKLRKSDYLGLLDKKRDAFTAVQEHAEQNANEILSLFR